MKKGFTCSPYDLLHAGHVTMLRECKENCDYLIVGLNVNPMKRNKYPVQSVMERHTQLAAIKYIDEIIPYYGEADLLDLLELVQPDVRFIGDDYKGKDFTGDQLNIPVHYNSRNHKYSTYELKERIVHETDILDGNTIRDNDTYRVIDNTSLEEMTISTTSLHPKQSTSGHSHEDQEEVYHFLSGSGLIMIDNVQHVAEAGKTFTIAAGAYHRVENTSAHDDLAFFCVFGGKR